MEPFHDPAVSHGICTDCVERDSLDDAPVLVVSPRRAQAIPVLQTLLRGAPEIAIVVDRRAHERRGEPARARAITAVRSPTSSTAARPTARRAPSLYLV